MVDFEHPSYASFGALVGIAVFLFVFIVGATCGFVLGLAF
jgi:hypothetical protein